MSQFINIEQIPVEKLTVSPLNVRKQVGSLEELKDSIKSMGLLQPILVRPTKEGLEVVVGQRRFLACKSLGWKTIPAIIKDMTDREALILSLTENIQIDSIDPIDRANGVKRLIENLEQEMPRTQAIEWVAHNLGKVTNTIYDWLALLRTSEGVQAMIRERKIATEVGARLATLPEKTQEKVAEVIHEEYIPQRRAVKIIEEIREKVKQETLFEPREIKEIVKETIEELEEYSVTVSFAGSLYKALSMEAQRKKTTIQEIVRRAVKEYLRL